MAANELSIVVQAIIGQGAGVKVLPLSINFDILVTDVYSIDLNSAKNKKQNNFLVFANYLKRAAPMNWISELVAQSINSRGLK